MVIYIVSHMFTMLHVPRFFFGPPSDLEMVKKRREVLSKLDSKHGKTSASAKLVAAMGGPGGQKIKTKRKQNIALNQHTHRRFQ